MSCRFVHVNLIAGDWRMLADFYQDVFGCVPVPPMRHYRGPVLESGTGIHGAELHGIHLKLPGYEGHGPTLEIFQYDPAEERTPMMVNRPGYGHIAFSVADVDSARERVLAKGGTAVGEVVTLTTTDGRKVTWTYITDPEGNVIELQSWTDR